MTDLSNGREVLATCLLQDNIKGPGSLNCLCLVSLLIPPSSPLTSTSSLLGGVGRLGFSSSLTEPKPYFLFAKMGQSWTENPQKNHSLLLAQQNPKASLLAQQASPPPAS